MRRAALIAVALVALATLGLVADAVGLSATRLYPRYDEVAYLALARDFAREGGNVAAVRCYLEGRCREDNRPPLFQFLLEPFATDSPRFFADAKLVTLATVLLLLVAVFLAARRVFSTRVAIGSVIALAWMPVLSDLGAKVLHDPLYVLLTFAAVYSVAAWQERGFVAWLGAGALVGLAFLTKGSGHWLWVPLLAASLYRHRATIWRRPIVYAAACGFVAVAFFLMWRNTKLWGSPFYNTNARQLWIDQWRDVWALQLSPEWSKVGFGWYLSRHSIWRLIYELLRESGKLIGYFVYAAGVGPAAGAARVVTGAAVMILAVLGIRRRWRAGGHGVEIIAVLSTVGFFFAGLALAARGGPGAQVRYVLPYVVLLLPFAVHEALERLWPPLRARLAARWPGQAPEALAAPAQSAGSRLPEKTTVAHRACGAERLALGGLGALLIIRLAVVAPGAAVNPRASYAVEPHWHETSEWLSRALVPGERFATDYRSYYSTWDVPRPDTDPRWNFWLGMPTAELLPFMQRSNIRKVLIDADASGHAELADKLSPARDAHGPLTFLDWPRCFTDSATPSRFAVYCEP
ncbi:MAG TPA: glycosyltransferase family 39 protein [Polyangia bacterium]|jgi:4-amino-4-deoxy-L-arabinose transferase-like glycosyltransferase|nr:glycosyltransferase family 39 protein [Polyangia bacterium]